MFAPKVAKPQTKAAEVPTSRLATGHSTIVGHRLDYDPFEQVLLLQRSIGNQATLLLLAQRASRAEQEVAPENMTAREAPPLPGIIQPKLVVGEVNDPLEREADRVSDRVMRMSDPGNTVAAPSPHISRECMAGEGKQRLQAPVGVHQALRSPGQPLDRPARVLMERRFGHDFSRVRTHTNIAAAGSAEQIHARAYTVGNDVVFAAGQFAPDTDDGQKLLAHELTHVVQQQGSAQLIQRQPDCGPGGCMTDDDLAARLEALKDPELKALEADDRLQEAKRKAKEADDAATRHERLVQFGIILKQKHYLPEDVRDMMDEHLSMRDMMVLRHFGFVYPTNLITRSKVRTRVIDAIDSYSEDWDEKHRNTPEAQLENEKQDEFQAVVNADTARAQSAYNPEVAEAVTGGLFGSIGYGIGGDKGALAGATIDNMVQAVGLTAEARSAMSEAGHTSGHEDTIADIRPVETNAPEVEVPFTGGGGGATEPPTGNRGGSPSRPPAQTIKASPPPPPQQTSRPGAPTPVTDVEVVKTNVDSSASIKRQSPSPHQTDWTVRGGTGKAPAAYRDREGIIHVSTDHPLMGDPNRGGIPPVRPGGITPPVRTPSHTQLAPSSTPTRSGSDIGLEDTGKAPAPAKPAVDPGAKTPPAPPKDAPVPKDAPTGGAAAESKRAQAPRGKIDPPQAVSRELVENIRNRPRTVDPRRKGSGGNVHYTTDHEAHELAWKRLGGRGESPPAFIYDNQVYLDPSRW